LQSRLAPNTTRANLETHIRPNPSTTSQLSQLSTPHSKSHVGSFAAYAQRNVVAPLGLAPAECLLLDGAAADAALECAAFEASLRHDPLAVAVLGLGTNGHVAFNDPPSLGSSLTRELPLTAGSIAAAQHDFPDTPADALPTTALTIGMQTLQDVASVCLVLVCGAKKQAIVRKVLHEAEYEGPDVPASQLRGARNFIFCLDEDAAAGLPASCRDRALNCAGVAARAAAALMDSAIARCRLDVSRLVVNGDIGGTNARMQLWEVSREVVSLHRTPLPPPPPLLRFDKRYQSSSFDGIEPLVRTFLVDAGIMSGAAGVAVVGGGDDPVNAVVVDALVLAICGPVVNETRSAGPVLPEQGPTGWGADVGDLVRRLNGKVRRAKLLNDFVAVGLGVPLMAGNAAYTVNLHTPPSGKCGAGVGVDGASSGGSSTALPSGTMAAVGAGTGLGEVYLTWNSASEQYDAQPSEGGMAEFCATSDTLWEIRKFLQQRDGHVTVEGLVSGPGIANIYAYMVDRDGDADKDTNVVRDVVKAHHPATITRMGMSGTGDPRCKEALRVFVTALAAHLRQTALHILPTGGLFLCGGIPPRIVPLLKEMLAPGLFVEDPVMGAFLRENIPLWVISNDDVGLLGARVRAERMLE
jgi:glucokinase